MCGIAGYIGSQQLAGERIDNCLRLMRRRGPDAAGAYEHAVAPESAAEAVASAPCPPFTSRGDVKGGRRGTEGGLLVRSASHTGRRRYTLRAHRRDAGTTGQEAPSRRVCLLHTRLSIIDLDTRANQPFRVGPVVLVCNGELYNYLELRRELSAAGHEFVTASDTEVLLKVLLHHGWQGLDRCEGMWAFALYNESDGSLVLCRDRFGEKPLYLYRDGTSATLDIAARRKGRAGGRRCSGGLYFGSEVKFISALRGSSPEPNYNHLLRYLVNGYKSLYKTRETFFDGIEELAPGTVLRIDADGSESRWRYWQPSFEPDDSMTFEQAVEGVRAALIESMGLRLRADVPLAFCMSGGIDSNSLIAVAKRHFRFDVHGFTIVNQDRRYDEREEVDTAVAALGIRHTSVPLTTRSFLDNLRLLARQHDAPVYTISYYVHWLLMAAIAEQGYKISVSGVAADELLTGYYDHHNLWLYEMRDDPAFPQALAAWRTHIAPLVRNPHLQDPLLYHRDPACRAHVYLGCDEFAARLHRPWSEAFTETAYSPSLLRNRMLNELFHEAVPVLLHEDDLNAMYFSIENRSPFLDRRLFEFSCRIPTRCLMGDGYTKLVLRTAMAGFVPDRVLWNRRKVGFNAPVLDLLDRRSPSVRRAILADSKIYELVRRDSIAALLDRDSLPNSESKFLFSFLAAKMFLEEFG